MFDILAISIEVSIRVGGTDHAIHHFEKLKTLIKEIERKAGKREYDFGKMDGRIEEHKANELIEAKARAEERERIIEIVKTMAWEESGMFIVEKGDLILNATDLIDRLTHPEA